ATGGVTPRQGNMPCRRNTASPSCRRPVPRTLALACAVASESNSGRDARSTAWLSIGSRALQAEANSATPVPLVGQVSNLPGIEDSEQVRNLLHPRSGGVELTAREERRDEIEE